MVVESHGGVPLPQPVGDHRPGVGEVDPLGRGRAARSDSGLRRQGVHPDVVDKAAVLCMPVPTPRSHRLSREVDL